MGAPGKVCSIFGAVLLQIQISTVINGQCMPTEIENPVPLVCFDLGSLGLCLSQGNIRGTVTAIRDNTCSRNIDLDLTVSGLRDDELCTATAVDCVKASDTDGGSANTMNGLLKLLADLTVSKNDEEKGGGGSKNKGYGKGHHITMYQDVKVDGSGDGMKEHYARRHHHMHVGSGMKKRVGVRKKYTRTRGSSESKGSSSR